MLFPPFIRTHFIDKKDDDITTRAIENAKLDAPYVAVEQLNTVKRIYDSSTTLSDEQLTQSLEIFKRTELTDLISRYESVRFS